MNRRWAVAPVLLLAALLAGCSANGGSAGSDAAAGPEAAGPAAVASGVAPGSGSSAGSSAGPAAGVARAVVRTATLTLHADDPAGVADRAGTLADAAGGRVDSDDRSGSAHVVLRVPATALDATLTALAQLGDEVSRQVQGDDVTAQQADVDARVTALQTSVTRLQGLITSSADLDALLQVETQLTQRQSDLESLQAQQRALADQVSLATITLDVTTPAAAARAASPTGFGHAVVSGWHGLVLAVRYLLAAVGYVLPVVLVLAALVVPFVLLVRRRRREPRPPVIGPELP